jgi:hypothetical protein
LNSYILAVPAWFGAPVTFFTTRLIACGLIISSIFGLYFIVKWTFTAESARLSIVPPVAFLGLTWEWDFLHYASEYFSICLTTIGMAAATYLATDGRPNGRRRAACAVGGVLLGSVAFAKLQALPIALVALTFMAGIILLKGGRPRKERRTEALITAAAFALIPGAITISLLSTGEWNDMVISYLKSAVFHVTSGTTVGFTYFFRTVVTYTTFLAGCATVIVAGAITLIGRRRLSRRSAIIILCALCLLAVSFVVIVTPRHDYPHYLLFSVLPLSFCVAIAFGLMRDTQLWRDKETLLSSVIAAGFLVPALSLAMESPGPYLGDMRDVLLRGRPELASYLPFRQTFWQVQAIKKYAAPGSRVAIWGWMPHYYVQTQTIPATRDAHTKPQATVGPYQEYFLERFLSDLRKRPPPVFVDAAAPVCFGINDRATQGFETFPALAAFINANYLLKEDVEGVRIFVLKDPGTPAARPDSGS